METIILRSIQHFTMHFTTVSYTHLDVYKRQGQNTSVDSKMMVLSNIRTIGYNIKTKMWVSRALPSWPCPFLFFEFSRSQLYFSGFAFPLFFCALPSCPEHRQTSRFSQPGAFGECGRRLEREFPNNLHQAPGLIVKVSIQTNFFLLLNLSLIHI